MTTQQRSEAAIDAILASMIDTTEANKLRNVPGLSFSTGRPGEYAPAKTATINAANIQQFSIDTGDGHTRYFRRIPITFPPNPAADLDAAAARAQQQAIDAGFRASVWQETDRNGAALTPGGRTDLRFSFPGVTGAQVVALTAVISGTVNPQVNAVPGYVNAVLDQVGRDNVGSVHVGGHSLGTQNALVAQRCLVASQVTCDTMTAIEPFGAPLAQRYIYDQLRNPRSVLSQQIYTGAYAEDIGNPNMESVYDQSYRSVTMGANGALTYTMAARQGAGRDPGNNAPVGAAHNINMTAAPDVAPPVTGPLALAETLRGRDTNHMTANIASRLLTQNIVEHNINRAINSSRPLIEAGIRMLGDFMSPSNQPSAPNADIPNKGRGSGGPTIP